MGEHVDLTCISMHSASTSLNNPAILTKFGSAVTTAYLYTLEVAVPKGTIMPERSDKRTETSDQITDTEEFRGRPSLSGADLQLLSELLGRVQLLEDEVRTLKNVKAE